VLVWTVIDWALLVPGAQPRFQTEWTLFRAGQGRKGVEKISRRRNKLLK
jgi:hypothetical protein